jgi:hypothetical protein
MLVEQSRFITTHSKYLLDVKVPSPGNAISETSTDQWPKYTRDCKDSIDDTAQIYFVRLT